MLTIYRLFELSDNIVYDSVKMYNYVITPDSLMRSKMSSQHLTELGAKEKIVGYIGDKYPELKAKAEAAELISKLNICNRILCESPEMGELYDRLVKEVRAGAAKILHCGFADFKTKLMALVLRVNERLYRGCIRLLYCLIKGK
jgi:plasmid stabilization system protein ParE